MRLPDFIIGGAPRSGTTWLYELLDRHPRIYLAKPTTPEPKFFLRDDLYQKGLEYYAQTWFAGAGADQIKGEKSTNYLESGAAAERMAADLPDAKLIFILREPAERAYSNYRWSRMNGLEQEDFETALRLEPQRERELPEALRFARPHSYFSRGLYAALLRPYVSRFPRDQVLVLKFEDAIASAEQLAGRVHRFLGVASRPGDARGLGIVNAAEPDADGMPDDVRVELRERYREPNRQLAELLGSDFNIWA